MLSHVQEVHIQNQNQEQPVLLVQTLMQHAAIQDQRVMQV